NWVSVNQSAFATLDRNGYTFRRFRAKALRPGEAHAKQSAVDRTAHIASANFVESIYRCHFMGISGRIGRCQTLCFGREWIWFIEQSVRCYLPKIRISAKKVRCWCGRVG